MSHSEDDKKPDEEQKKDNDNSSAEIEEVIKHAPPEVKKFLSMSFSRHEVSSGPFSRNFFDSIADKLKPEHISQVIINSDKSDKRGFLHSLLNMLRQLITLGVVVAFSIWAFIFLLKDINNPTLFGDIIKVGLGLIGGFGAGYGYKSRKNK